MAVYPCAMRAQFQNVPGSLGGSRLIRPIILLITGAIALIVVVVAIGSLVELGLIHPNLADLSSYRAGAARAFGFQTPYSDMQLAGPYPLDAAAWGRGFVYPPPVAFLFSPLFIQSSASVWNIVTVTAFVLVALTIVRREWGPLGPIASVVVLAIFLLQPGLQEVKEGQMSPLIAAAVGMMWLQPRRAGYWAVAAGLFKVFPLAGLVWASRRRGSVLRPIGILAVVVFASLILTPGWWRDWLTSISNARAACSPIALPSFTCVGFGWMGYLLAGALCSSALILKRDDMAFAALSVGMVIGAPDIYWGYMLIPFIGLLPLASHVARGLRSATSGPTYRDRISVPAR
jgi:hypothetical protein